MHQPFAHQLHQDQDQRMHVDDSHRVPLESMGTLRQITVISGKIEFLSISPDFVSMQTVTMWILAGNGWMV